MSERALLVGGSGLIGSALLQELLDAGVEVLLPLRDPSGWRLAHPQLASAAGLQVVSYDELWTIQRPLTQFFSALGTTRAQAGRDGLLAVDYQLVVECARYARQQGAVLASVVSALGANPVSPFFYNRVKGRMESAIRELAFDRTHIWRPSVLLGSRTTERPAEKLAGWLLRSGMWRNWQALPGSVVASAMKKAALHDDCVGVQVLAVTAIKRYSEY